MLGDYGFDVWSEECCVGSVLFDDDFMVGDIRLPDDTNYSYLFFHRGTLCAILGLRVSDGRDLYVTLFSSFKECPYVPSLERLAFEACRVLRADRVVIDFDLDGLGEWVDSRDSLFARAGSHRYVLEYSDCALAQTQ